MKSGLRDRPNRPGTIALGDAGEIELGVLKKSAFGGESGLQRVLAIFCEERAEEIRAHAGVKILADLESDFGFFGEGKRNVFGDLVFRVIEMSECEEIWRVHMFRRLNGDACGGNGFGQDSLGKFCGGGNGGGGSCRLRAGRYGAADGDSDRASALVAGSEISRSDLDSAGPVVT